MEVLIDASYRPEDIEPLPLVELATFILKKAGKPENTEVSISFVDDEEIAQLNEQYRGKPGPTEAIYGTTFEREITILAIHGLLHLCGYDHVTDEDAAIMEPLEDDLLAEWEAARA